MKIHFTSRTLLVTAAAVVIAIVSLAILGLSNRADKKTKLPPSKPIISENGEKIEFKEKSWS
ncbi:hypothetical protein LEP1GSC198_1926 [Leptospira kirschneri str. JB]|nr:hypothetical protein LEP1GSC198_1926 [Leptospira kirschneri str. JB]